MANRYRKLPAHSPVTAFSITAYNRMIDMLNWWQVNQSHSGGGPIRNLVDLNQGVFKLKNSSGLDIATGGVVGVSGPLYTPAENLAEFKNVTPLEAVEPVVADHSGGRWAVALELTADEKIGRFCVSGVVPVRVYITAAADQYCDVIAAETVGTEDCYLGTGKSGARILWRENEGSGAEGIEWAIVRLGADSDLTPFELKDDITPGGTAIDAYPMLADLSDADDEADTFEVNDGILGDCRALGRDTKSASNGARGFYTMATDGSKQIVSIQRQAKRCSAILAADAGPGATVNVDNVVPLDGGQSPVSESSTTLSCTMPPAGRALDNAVCVIEWDETTDAWKIRPVHEQARMLRGTLSGAMATSDGSKSITSPVAMDGGQVPSGTVTGYNVFDWEGDYGGEIVAAWNETTDHYEFIQVECPA